MRPVNLLPADQRRRPAGGRSGSAYVVVGVLAGLLVLISVYALTSSQVSSRKGDAAEARAEAERLEQQVQQYSAYTSFAQIKQTRLASVTSVAGSRFDWERLVRELALVMPEGSWFHTADASLTGQLASSSSTSTPPTTTTSAAPAQPAANLTGCTPRQSDVAKMMVRLERLHRVQNVELNESVQEDPNTSPTIESCGRYYEFDLTVTFSPTETGEAPRGETRVPASLGGGS